MQENANRLDPGQPTSNSASGLRSNLFATQTIIAHQKQVDFQGLNRRQQFNRFLETYPAFNELKVMIETYCKQIVWLPLG